MFFQSLGGGKTASVLLSLVQTAEAAGVNAKEYLRDVLVRIATECDVTKLLPHAWKEHFEGEVIGRRNEILKSLGKSRE
jgi:transposase IS66-like protein